MIPFLRNIAQVYYANFGNRLSNFTFVFSNHRSGIFFRHYLGLDIKQPMFSPNIQTVADLFEALSPYKKADRIELLFILYQSYSKLLAKAEPFDDFIYWGEMLLNDFDDIDKYMADARQLFTNIYDLKAIDSDYSFMSEEQIMAIRRFWSNFLPVGDSEKKKEFVETWQILYPLYKTFKEQLVQLGIAYDGMIFREVAENIEQKDLHRIPRFEKVIFIGLNGHSKSEEIVLKHLKKIGIADFYWDYSSPLVSDKLNKASAFIDKNKVLFPSSYSLKPEDQTLEKPVLQCIGVPSSVGQAKYTYTLLQQLMDNKQTDPQSSVMDTAVILPDENLLLPVLYSIPETIQKINVTMGYTLSNSSIAGLVQHIIDLRQQEQKNDQTIRYYYRPVLSLLNHTYIKKVARSEADALKEYIIKYNRILLGFDELDKHPLFRIIFRPVTRWDQMGNYLKEILAYLQQTLLHQPDATDQSTTLNQIESEFITEYYKCINRMEKSIGETNAPDMSIDTYCRLLKKLANNITVSFSGEPLSGLQIMGVLETRALDFKNIIILSMNEGIFPMKKNTGSFIPYNLRRGFELPTYEHQDSIFAYHFYRMLNRAQNIYLLYDTRTEGVQSGEVSRYYKQIKYLYSDHFDIQEKQAIYKITANESLSVSVNKTPKIMQKLDQFLTGNNRSLSASAINMYINCPLQFYFSVVEQMEEEAAIEETVEASLFGTIFHSIMEQIYAPLCNRQITADILNKIRKDDLYLTKLIEESFAHNYFKTDKVRPLTGQNYLTGEVIRKYVKQILKLDAGMTPFIYRESEKRISADYKPENSELSISLKGFIDRIDEVNGISRIIDYKTGKGSLIFRSIEELFDKNLKDRPKAIMQVFMYALIYAFDHPANTLKPAIYYLRNSYDTTFNSNIIDRSSGKPLPVENFSVYIDDFKQHFDSCLSEIFDPSIPFTQTTTNEACKWCPFVTICKK